MYSSSSLPSVLRKRQGREKNCFEKACVGEDRVEFQKQHAGF